MLSWMINVDYEGSDHCKKKKLHKQQTYGKPGGSIFYLNYVHVFVFS